MRAGIYTRLSQDPDGTSTATQRQEADCRALCKDRGWAVAKVYQDNDTSAFSRKVRRPAFEAMVEAAAAGELDVIVAWKSDRLARQPRDLERVLDACETGGGYFASCTEPEFQGAAGLLILRMMVAFAAHESGVKSERVARAAKQRAEEGRPPVGGGRMLGYSGDGMSVVPAEAELIREATARILAGESVYGVCQDWNEKGVQQPHGGAQGWRTTNLARTLQSPRLAALRAYQGQILGPGAQWPAILDQETWERLQVALSRRHTHRPARKYVLTGLVHCGTCGAPMRGTVRSTPPAPYYMCPPPAQGGCSGVAVKAERLETEVTERLFAVLTGPALASLLAQSVGEAGPEILEALREAENSLEQLAKDHYVERLLTRPEFLAAREGLEGQIESYKRQLDRSHSPLAGLPGGDAAVRAHWTKRGLTWRRALLDAVVEKITVQSANRSNRWNPDRVEVTWRA